ncbi:MAG: SRPBCC family protein [Myxococcales bacterium]|nr:SRPBCC family protein [Myxococcales bacterium]
MRKFLTVFILLAAWSTTALAEQQTGKVDASVARLGALNQKERALLAPYLARGPVVLTEFQNRQTDLPAVIYAARINAPAKTVAEVIGKPSDYPRFMSALTSVDIRSVNGQMMAFDWTWGVTLFTLTGHNVMTTYPGDSERGYRFDIRTTGGDLGIGRVMWRIYPEGPNGSLIVFSSRLDMRDANYVTRQLAAEGNAMNRTINVAVAMVTLLEVRAEAERRAGTYSAREFAAKPLERPTVDMGALRRLLGRGDLVLMDLEGETLQRVTVVGRSGSSVGRVRRVMLDPEEFGKSFLHGSCAEVVERTDHEVKFDWEIPIPLVHMGGQMVLRPSPTVIAIDGVSGTLSKGRWRFDTYPYPGGEAGVIAWATFDPADSPKLIRKLIAGNTHFSHGFVAATQLGVMRSLRTRVQQWGR